MKSITNEYRYFLKSNPFGVNKLFVLAYSNEDDNSKRFQTKRFYLPKDIIKNYNVIINGKNFYDEAIDSSIKRYEEIRKLTTGQGQDYITGFLLEYGYIKSHCRLVGVDLSRQKESDVDPKAIQQIDLAG